MYETASKLGPRTDAFRQVGPKQWRSVLALTFEAFANTHRTDATWLRTELKREGVAMRMDNALAHLSTLVAQRRQFGCS